MICELLHQRLNQRPSLFEFTQRRAVHPDYRGGSGLNILFQSVKNILSAFGEEPGLTMKKGSYPNAKTEYLNGEIVQQQVVSINKAGQNKAKTSEYSLPPGNLVCKKIRYF